MELLYVLVWVLALPCGFSQVEEIGLGHLPTIVSDFFSDCDILITSDSKRNSTGSELKRISSSFPTTPKLHIDFSTYPDFDPVNWNVSDKSGNCSEIPCFRTSVRKFAQCALVISLFLEGVAKMPYYQEVVLSPYFPPARKEQDHFIFITMTSSQLETVLMHESLSTVKFKLGFSADGEDASVSTTVCLFCDRGEARLMSIDVTPRDGWTVRDIYPDFTRNGHGHVVKLSGPLKYPFLYELDQDQEGNWRSKRGVYKYILSYMLAHFNYSYVVFPSINHGSGKKYSNGSWDGVIGDVLYGRADVGTASSANHQRYPLQLTFTTAVVYIYVSFMMGPPKITYSWKAIYWPFTPDMWLAVVITLIATILTFKLMQKRDKAPESLLLFRHLWENVSFTLIGQGLPYPDAHSSRVLMAIWLFTALIINTLYVSKIVGLLAFPLYQVQPMTFKQLTESKFHWGFDQSGGSMLAFFKSSSNPVFHKIFENLEPDKEAVECFDVAMERDFACITWTGVADYIAYRNLTWKSGRKPLVFANEITLFVPCGVILQRRSLYKVIFEDILGYLRDSGQADKWNTIDYLDLRKEKRKWQQSINININENADDGPELLSLSNLLGIFYIYIIGHVLASILFISEFAKSRKILKKQNNNVPYTWKIENSFFHKDSLIAALHKIVCCVNYAFVKELFNNAEKFNVSKPDNHKTDNLPRLSLEAKISSLRRIF